MSMMANSGGMMANQVGVLWMGSLERYMDENYIRTAFSQMGEIISGVKMMKNKYTGEAQGYCFVQFPDDFSALTAMHKLNNKIIPNSQPQIKFRLNHTSLGGKQAMERDFSLWVGDLSSEVDDFTLYKGFASRYPSVRLAKVILDSNGFSKGYGFVRFADEDEQKDALNHMNGFKGVGCKALRVSVAINRAGGQKANNALQGQAMAAVQAMWSAQNSQQQSQHGHDQQQHQQQQGQQQQHQPPNDYSQYYQQYYQNYAAWQQQNYNPTPYMDSSPYAAYGGGGGHQHQQQSAALNHYQTIPSAISMLGSMGLGGAGGGNGIRGLGQGGPGQGQRPGGGGVGGDDDFELGGGLGRQDRNGVGVGMGMGGIDVDRLNAELIGGHAAQAHAHAQQQQMHGLGHARSAQGQGQIHDFRDSLVEDSRWLPNGNGNGSANGNGNGTGLEIPNYILNN